MQMLVHLLCADVRLHSHCMQCRLVLCAKTICCSAIIDLLACMEALAWVLEPGEIFLPKNKWEILSRKAGIMEK